MAIQTLGIKMVINGAMKVARDLYTVSSSLYQLSRATTGVQQALAVFRLAITTTTTAVDIFFTAVTIGLGALKLLFNILSKIAGIAFSGIKTAFNILWSIITLPFKIAIAGLQGLWEGIKRIGEIAIGMNLSNLIWHIGTQIKDIGAQAFEAASDFQLLEIRMRALIQRELAETGQMSFSQSMGLATEKTKELTYWISNLAVRSIFNAETIANTVTLAMAYDFTTKEAQNLTEAIANFATGMGLGNVEMQRIVENFGQMRAQGKLTGTELRDLARGAFVPVNEVAKQMLINLGKDVTKIKDFRKAAQDLVAGGKASVDDYFRAFITYTGENFPDAIDKASASMKVVTSNIQDFIQTVVGWRVIKPSLDEVSGRLSKLLSSFLGDEARKLGENVGAVFKYITAGIFRLSDVMSPAFLKDTEKFFGKLNKELFDPLRDFISGKTSFDVANVKLQLFLTTLFRGLKPEAVSRISAGILQLGDAFKTLGKVDAKTSFQKIWAGIKEVAGAIWDTIIFPAAKDFWDNTIKPKLLEVWGYVYGFLKEVWEKKVPAWWSSTGEPAVIKMLGQLGDWFTQSPMLQEIGRIIVNGIANSMTAIGNSGILQAATTLIVSALQGAAAAGLQALTGALMQSTETDFNKQYFDPHLDPHMGEKMGESPQFKKPEGPFQSIIDAIDRLRDSARRALDTALTEFNQTIASIFQKSNGDFTGFSQLTQTLIVLSLHGKAIGEAITTISEALGKLGININLGKFNGFAGFLNTLLQISLTPLYALANTIQLLADAVGELNKNWQSSPIATWLGGGSAQNQANSMMERLNQVMPGQIQVGPAQQQSWVERNFGPLLPAIEGLKTKITNIFNNMFEGPKNKSSEVTSSIQGHWQDLSSALVGNSIIPDMLTAIATAFSTKLPEIVNSIDVLFVNPVMTMLEGMDLYNVGVNIMATLRKGLESQASALLDWFRSFASQFRINASVNVTQTTTTSSTGTSAADNIGNRGNKGKGQVGGAKGLNFVVPSGYPNDAYTVKVTSGEQVIVIPNAMRSMFARSYSGAAWNYNTAGAMYSNSTTNNVTRVYNLNVNSNRTLESLSTEFGIIRLLGDNHE